MRQLKARKRANLNTKPNEPYRTSFVWFGFASDLTVVSGFVQIYLNQIEMNCTPLYLSDKPHNVDFLSKLSQHVCIYSLGLQDFNGHVLTTVRSSVP